MRPGNHSGFPPKTNTVPTRGLSNLPPPNFGTRVSSNSARQCECGPALVLASRCRVCMLPTSAHSRARMRPLEVRSTVGKAAIAVCLATSSNANLKNAQNYCCYHGEINRHGSSGGSADSPFASERDVARWRPPAAKRVPRDGCGSGDEEQGEGRTRGGQKVGRAVAEDVVPRWRRV